MTKDLIPYTKDTKQVQFTSMGLCLEQRTYLFKIGLSKDAIGLYELLLKKGKLSAQQAASLTGGFPAAHYRLFYALEKHLLVRKLSGRPKMFEAAPVAQGFRLSFYNHESEMRRLLGSLIKEQETGEMTASVILGRQALYDEYVRLVKSAQSEVRLYSIGIAYSEKLEQAQRGLIKRGVRIRHVIQQRKLSNQYVIAKWQRMGVKLRYLNQLKGFHFFIVDNQIVCITFSDPMDTDNRISLVTNNPAAVKVFVSEFQLIWSQASTVKS